jgi:hypothetical protein
MVFKRLFDPSSKLGVLRRLDTVALPRGFGFAAGAPDDQQLLRALNVIDDHSAEIAERWRGDQRSSETGMKPEAWAPTIEAVWISAPRRVVPPQASIRRVPAAFRCDGSAR